MKLDNNKRIKVKMKNIKKLCFLILMSTVFSLSLGSCTKKDKKAESPAKEQTTNEHPEHPSEGKASNEHPEDTSKAKASKDHPSDDN